MEFGKVSAPVGALVEGHWRSKVRVRIVGGPIVFLSPQQMRTGVFSCMGTWNQWMAKRNGIRMIIFGLGDLERWLGE